MYQVKKNNCDALVSFYRLCISDQRQRGCLIFGGGGERTCAVTGNIFVLEILIPAVSEWNGWVEMVLCN